MSIFGKLTAEPPSVPPAVSGKAGEADKSKETDKSLPDPTGLAATIAFVLFLVAVVVSIGLNAANLTGDEFSPSSQTEANFALFAGFYVAAQVIERLLEFVAPMLPPGKPATWLTHRFALGDSGYEKIKGDDAAMAVQIKADRAKLALGVAAVLGVLASCLFGLFFLKAIGMHVTHTVDAILTGITIAAGTKPLHDFTTSLQNSNTPATGTGTSEN